MVSGFGCWKLLILTLLFHLSHGKPDYCLLPPHSGPCEDRVYKYFYSEDVGTCDLFIFGGCHVNENVFDSMEVCMATCSGNGTVSTTSPTTTTSTVSPREIFAKRFKEVPYLVLENGTGQQTFTFDSPSSFIQIGPDEISSFQIRNRRSVSLEFRTRLPHAILVYHGILDRPSQLKKYELYIMLDQGQLTVKHLLGDHSTTVVVGKGLNRDKFHRVNVMIDPSTSMLYATVDDRHNTFAVIDGLAESPFYGAGNDDLNSTIFIGGLKSVDERLDISYLANPFVGCIRNVELASSPFASVPLESLTALISSRFNVEENCLNKCHDPSQPCSYDSRCINHYDHVECDCFTANFKGDSCRYASIPVLTLNGHSFITFTVYEWMDRVHSDANRIGLHFRTKVDDSILFYAAGEIPVHNHIGVTLKNQSVFISVDFGDESVEPILVQMGKNLTDGEWHHLTINHRVNILIIDLDGAKEKLINITGTHQHLYIDPDIHIGGGGPRLKNRQGLFSSNNFVGCLKEVYFNAKSVMWELFANRHQAQYHGSTGPVLKESCDLQNKVPITIPFAEGGFRISNPAPEELNLKFKFRTKEVFGTLAYSDIRTLKGEGFWELQVKNENVQFVLYSDKELASISASKSLVAKFNKKPGEWNWLHLNYSNGEVHLTTDKMHSYEKFAELFQLSPFITLGTSVYKPNTGFVGCIGNVEIGGQMLDARKIVGSADQIGDIALDNCMYADPCTRPKVCEHDGKCAVQNGQVTCDCSETGYIGKHCHFAIFKRTCEELALLGYTESGVYKIDIDGNGPFSPSNVKCKFETDPSGGETKTIVEHNLANETDIWNPNEEKVFDFSVALKYREFSPEMINSLVSQSVQCSQYIKYDCYKTRLDLQLSTWFKSADSGSVSVVSIGEADRFTCPCYATKSCVGGKSCNCDSGEGKWLSDEGYFSDPERLGVTGMFFMVPKNLSTDSASRITLGPLECVEANTQRYVVTFKTFGSYLEAPGWKTGDLAFSFRTTRSSAILLYQPLLHPQHNAFSVFLANEHELVFRFILNGGEPQKVVVRSQRVLSGGEWQQVWIDFDLHQVRFQINDQHQMINLPDGQVFGPFESTMYIAGAPSIYLEEEDKKDTVQDGLIGCFRGLVMNTQVVDLYSYMKFHKADIVKDCSPSCDPNPCKNKATCIENWGSFTCSCQNPWSQSGEFCENDLNVDGLTFLSQSSFIREANLHADLTPVRNILTSNFYLNLRTYDSAALVLYANDNLNNFAQIHIEEGSVVIFTWNHGDTIRQLRVGLKALNHGKQIQIAVTRNYSHTALHVNSENASIHIGISLLTVYSREPWTNPELETFSPPRPFAAVSTYYQLLLGGYDQNALIPSGKKIPGMLGCLRGLKIGNDHVKLSGYANNHDVLDGCKMVCDNKPCKNNGLCLEDFISRTYSCDCVYTSYHGKTCSEERGVSFHGESYIRRRFKYPKPMTNVSDIDVHFGFSTSYSEADTLLLAVSLPGQSYSLLLAINKEGHFMLREEHQGRIFDAVISYQNFIDGSRHSIYFQRHGNETLFIVDHEEIRPSVTPSTGSAPIALVKDPSIGEVFVAGVNEETASLSTFKKFKGCLSNIFVKIGEIETSPIEEYMGYKKKEADAILDGEKFDGIKLGPCAAFSLFRRAPSSQDPRQSDLQKDMTSSESDWINTHPEKVVILLRPKEEIKSSTITFDNIAVLCGAFLLGIILFVIIYIYRLNKQYRRRMLNAAFDEDDVYFTHRGNTVRYQDPLKSNELTGYEKIDPEKTNLIQNAPDTVGNNNYQKPPPPVFKEPHRKASAPPLLPEKETPNAIDDENASSDTSSNGDGDRKGSLTSEDSSNTSLNHTEALDEKEPYGVHNGSLPNCTTIEEVTESEMTDHDDDSPSSTNPRLPSLRLTRRNMTPSPVYLSPHVRTFETSPIAMIGGPRYNADMKRSKESILSLD